MAIPTYQSTGTYLTGTATTSAAVAVPTGVVSGSFVMVFLYKESSAAVTPPASFVSAPNSPQNTAGTGLHYAHLYWKRATGADAGTYSFTWTGSTYREAVAIRCEGVYPSGDPWETGSGASRDTDAVLTPAVSMTTRIPEELWVYFGTNFAGGDWPDTMSLVATSGFGARTIADSDIWVGTLGQGGAGSSGALQAECAASSAATSWIGALKPTSAIPSPAPMLSKTVAATRASFY